jgi:hypothetical protein
LVSAAAVPRLLLPDCDQSNRQSAGAVPDGVDLQFKANETRRSGGSGVEHDTIGARHGGCPEG